MHFYKVDELSIRRVFLSNSSTEMSSFLWTHEFPRCPCQPGPWAVRFGQYVVLTFPAPHAWLSTAKAGGLGAGLQWSPQRARWGFSRVSGTASAMPALGSTVGRDAPAILSCLAQPGLCPHWYVGCRVEGSHNLSPLETEWERKTLGFVWGFVGR